jgi:hypothetical protein
VAKANYHLTMATVSNVKSCNATFSTTTADTAELLQPWDVVEVTNLDGTDIIYFRDDGTTAVAAAEGTTAVPPNTSKLYKPRHATDSGGYIKADGTAAIHSISLVGDGGAWSVVGLSIAEASA